MMAQAVPEDLNVVFEPVGNVGLQVYHLSFPLLLAHLSDVGNRVQAEIARLRQWLTHPGFDSIKHDALIKRYFAVLRKLCENGNKYLTHYERRYPEMTNNLAYRSLREMFGIGMSATAPVKTASKDNYRCKLLLNLYGMEKAWDNEAFEVGLAALGPPAHGV